MNEKCLAPFQSRLTDDEDLELLLVMREIQERDIAARIQLLAQTVML